MPQKKQENELDLETQLEKQTFGLPIFAAADAGIAAVGYGCKA